MTIKISGGWPTDALNYIRDQGVSDGKKYTFKEETQHCKRTEKNYPPIAKIPNACELELNGDEVALKKLIAQYGPVAGTMGKTRTK